MFNLYALAASEPLTKRLFLNDSGEIQKGNYPPVKNFTSHVFEINTLADFDAAIRTTAQNGWCLLKGELQRDLDNESRAGSTDSNGTTNWICLDLDGLSGFKNIEDFMSSHPQLSDVSYIVQYSSSSGIANNKGLHAHVFILLSHPYHAQYLKGWLMQQNVDGELFSGKLVQQLTLNRTASVLHYPIDVTACQNDKLLYVAPPIVEKGVKFKLPKEAGDEFIHLVKKAKNFLPIERLQHGSIDRWKSEAQKRFNMLREAAKLPKVTGKAKRDKTSGYTIEPECGEFVITGIREERGFIYFNMNGGDSWSWYHPIGNYKYIHCFKDDRTYLTERILPNYYAACEQERRANAEDRRENGAILLAFRDLRSAAYFNGTWHPETRDLVIHQAKSELQLDHFLKQHGQPDGVGDFIPQWRMEFNPQSTVICDPATRYLNTYVPSQYYFQERAPARDLQGCPTIKKIILSAVSGGEWNEVSEHFLNWVAAIIQHRVKTRTAWVLHGKQGTGKGLIANKILSPLLGARYVQQKRMSELEEKFTGWLEEALVAVIDEIQVSASQRKSLISSDLKNWITEPTPTLRFMNRMPYQAENFSNFLLFSNMPDPVQIEDDDDRRYNIGDFQRHKLQITKKEVEEAIPAELPYFMDYLMQREADIERAGTIVRNQARRDVISANKNTLDMMCEAMLDGDLDPFVAALPDTKMLNEVASGNQGAIGVQFSKVVLRELTKLTSLPMADEDGYFRVTSRLSRDEIFVLLEHSVGNIPNSPSKFTRMLGYKHIELKRMRLDSAAVVVGLEVTWVASRQWIEDNRIPEQPKVIPLRGVKK